MANNYNGCNNNCEAVAGLQEKAANLVAYSNLINSWLNGPATGTVNIAGTNTPTLLKLVTDLRTKINQMPQSILLPNGGIKIDSNGKLYIDFNSMPPELLYNLLEKIILKGGGLAFNTDSKLYVDFNDPTNQAKLDELKATLHLQSWLTAHTKFYVRPRSGNAKDNPAFSERDWGRSEAKPFATIQGAINYVTSQYNFDKYNATIDIGPAKVGEPYYSGNRNEALNIGSYQSGTGRLILEGESRTATVCPPIHINSSGKYVSLKSLTIGSYPNVAVQDASLWVENSDVHLYDVQFDNSFMAAEYTGLYSFLLAENGSVVTVEANNDQYVGLYFKNGASSKSPNYCFNVKTRSQLLIYADLHYISDFDFSIVARASNFANIREAYRSWYQYPAQAPVASVTQGKTVNGQRFHGYNFSIIGIVYGENWFPGNTGGNVDASSIKSTAVE